MWSWASTKMPPIWPRIHWLGSVFGHDGSIWNFGVSAVKTGRTRTTAIRPMRAEVRASLVICGSYLGPAFAASRLRRDGTAGKTQRVRIDGTIGRDYTYPGGYFGTGGREQAAAGR